MAPERLTNSLLIGRKDIMAASSSQAIPKGDISNLEGFILRHRRNRRAKMPASSPRRLHTRFMNRLKPRAKPKKKRQSGRCLLV